MPNKQKAHKKNSLFNRPVELTENALKVLEKRYLKKDEQGRPIESPHDMFTRVSLNIASAERFHDPDADIEKVAGEFYDAMVSLEFLPNSPTLMNAGRDLQQLSACFVLPVEDSMESIFEAVKHTALIHKSGGGTGFSFSRLRPSGDMVGSTSGISSGPISFMTVFDSATEAIKQGGTRRGANMGILRVDHPDIMSFITCKADSSRLNNFNISVAITEAFMEAVKKDAEYELLSPRTGKAAGLLKAREVFGKIVEMAWRNGDPGIIFIDRINDDNPTPHVGRIEATNPCGEQPLLPYESCNLGSINLSRMVKTSPDMGAEVDWSRLKRITRLAVRFLDNVIDMNCYPIPEIEAITKANRKIGLGVMGFADMLIRLGVPYNSDEGIEIGRKVMRFIQDNGREATAELASIRGVFPNFKGSMYDKKGLEVRNATVTTIAPTGTISIIAGCSSGIEPLFALAFTRNVMEGAELTEVNPLFEEYSIKYGFDDPLIMKRVANTGGLKDILPIPDEIKDVFVTAHEITPEWHIKMQAVFQEYTDNAVSKTVNFSNHAKTDDVAEVYLLAYQLGCKGVTVYRDGSREVQVLTRGNEKKEEKARPLAADETVRPKPRSEVAFGITRKIKTGCGNLYVTINQDEEGRPFEIFTQIGKGGGCAASQCEAIGRMTSLALRSGVEPNDIIRQMRGISCHRPDGFGSNTVYSCSDALAQALEWYLGYKRAVSDSAVMGYNNVAETTRAIEAEEAMMEPVKKFTKRVGTTLKLVTSEFLKRGACPDCGGTVEHQDGCVVCRGCGYSEC
ncbi:MAG: vitamin B12-dependent ribonucleotide reductase [Deltaproteobacteria bacterium]|nr:vitamin B12-dependent ribonucleotide reductase [Deltaproteobacteria bacterium]